MKKERISQDPMEQIRNMFNSRKPFKIPGLQGEWLMKSFFRSYDSQTCVMTNIEGRVVTEVKFTDFTHG